MSYSNGQLINKINTTSLSGGGLMNPEQAKKFFVMVFEATPFSKLHRKEQRTVKQGELDKIAIGGRLLRKKTEDTDDNYRAGVSTSKIEYQTVAVRLPWEITEETLRENIEGQNFEDLVMNMMTTQTGIDLEDLHFNGDSASADPFLGINDGWLKLIANGTGAHILDHSAIGAKFNKTSLFKTMDTLPNKYRGDKIKWVMSPSRKLKWIEYLTNRATGAGDAALLSAGEQVNRPLGTDIVAVPSFPDDKILLTDPQNLIATWTYEVRIRKTTEGREAVLQDKRFYVIHFDDDPVVQEYDACVLVENVPDTIGD